MLQQRVNARQRMADSCEGEIDLTGYPQNGSISIRKLRESRYSLTRGAALWGRPLAETLQACVPAGRRINRRNSVASATVSRQKSGSPIIKKESTISKGLIVGQVLKLL